MQLTKHDVLIVVDVQNDFCPGGALAVPEGDAVIPVIRGIAEHFEHVVLTQDWHPLDHVSFASAQSQLRTISTTSDTNYAQVSWPDHCVQGTRGAEIHPALALERAELILRKGFRKEMDSYSAFFENDRKTPTGLAGYLRERGLYRVFLAGLAYDYCVGFSAVDARQMGFEAAVIQDACRAIDVGGSLEQIEKDFAREGVLLLQSAEIGGD